MSRIVRKTYATPNIIKHQVTGEQLLTESINALSETMGEILTNDEIKTLSNMRYIDGTKIIDYKRTDIIMIIIDLVITSGYQYTEAFIKDRENPDEIIWNQPAYDVGRNKIIREIQIYRYVPETGTAGKCKYCPSTQVYFAAVRMGGGDEQDKIFFKCARCTKTWRG